MPRVLGYADPLSVAPGEDIRFMVGTLDGPRRYRAEVVRLVSGDTGPGGPGLKTVRLPTSIEGEHEGRPQLIDTGSYVIVERPEALDALARFTVQAFVYPTRVPVRPERRRQAIMGTWAEDRRTGFALLLDEAGALAVVVGATLVSTGVPLLARRWYHVAAAVDLVAGAVALRQTPLAESTPSLEQPVAVTTGIRAAPPPGGDFFLGAVRRGVEDGRLRTTWHFNGKIDRPTLARRALAPAELAAAATARSTAVAPADAISRPTSRPTA
jgi:N,N-dimethylformamidase